MRSLATTVTGSAIGAVLALPLIAAFAQQVPVPPPADPGPPAPPEAIASEALAEIVVTARKRSERLIEVPVSVTALSKEAMQDDGVKGIEDIARLAPGVSFQTANALGTTDIAIRGIDSVSGTPTTGVYLDDVPIQGLSLGGLASNTYPKVFDLDRVEVLRGPQGTLYGAGSEGGTVRFITTAPSLTTTTGVVETDVAFTQRGAPSYEAGAAMGGPIENGKLGFRVSVWDREDGGYIDRHNLDGTVAATNTNSQHTQIAQASLVAQPLANLQITPSIFYQLQDTRDKAFGWEGNPVTGAPLAVDQSFAKIRQPQSDVFVLPSLSVEYDMEKTSFKSITSYFHRNNRRVDDYSYIEMSGFTLDSTIIDPLHPNAVVASQTNTGQRDWSQEFRWASRPGADGGLDWVGGLFYQHTSRLYDQALLEDFNTEVADLVGLGWLAYPAPCASGVGPAQCLTGEAPLGPNQGVSYLEHGRFNTQQAAAFGQVDYKATDRLTATLGLRVARTSFNFTDQQNGPDGPGAATSFGGSAAETPVTPKLTFKYDLEKDWMAYGGATKGYRVGGANEQLGNEFECLNVQPSLQAITGATTNPSTYHSDTVWSYELGSKGRFLNGRMMVDGSLFWIDWSNIQGNVLVPGCLLQFTTNFGRAVSRGIDLQVDAKVAQGLKFSGAIEYDDAVYRETRGFATGETMVQAGERLNTPPLSGNVGLEYRFELSSDASVFLRSDYLFKGPYDRLPSGNASMIGADWDYIRRVPASHFVNARAGYELDRWKFSLYVNNLLDSRKPLMRTDLPPGFLTATAALNGAGLTQLGIAPNTAAVQDVLPRPRTVGLSGEYRF